MPERETIERAERARRQGKSPSSQAGEFVREEIHHIREGKHGAASAKQAIAIGLSKARRAGVKLRAPRKGQASQRVRKQARRDLRKAASRTGRRPAPKRARASLRRLRRKGRRAASHLALARQAKAGIRKRTARQRSAQAKRAARTRRRTAARRARS